MKMKCISGIVCFVKDIRKTAEFYEILGFEFKTRTPDFATAYLNWFWIEFVAQDKAEKSVFQKELDLNQKGTNLFIHISVEDVDEFYESIISKGLKPSSKPKDFHWDRREFIVRDPDGYKLVFFQKI